MTQINFFKSYEGTRRNGEWDCQDKYRKRWMERPYLTLEMTPCERKEAQSFSIGHTCNRPHITPQLLELMRKDGEGYYKERTKFSIEGDLFPIEWLEEVLKYYEELVASNNQYLAELEAKNQVKAQLKASLMPMVNEMLEEHPGRWEVNKDDYLYVYHLDRGFYEWIDFPKLKEKGKPYIEHLVKKLEEARERFNCRREEQELEELLVNSVKAVLPEEFSCSCRFLEEGVFISFKDWRNPSSVLIQSSSQVEGAVNQLTLEWEEEIKVRAQRNALRKANKPIPKRKRA